MIAVFLCGEGRIDLGEWFQEPNYRKHPPDIGVLEVLLRKVRGDGWEVQDACQWKQIRKLRAGDHRRPEARNVLGAALHASEQGCDVLVFSRDRDGYAERERAIEDGIAAAASLFPELKIVGGVAIEEIESWVLSCLGERDAESIADAKDALEQRRGISNLPEIVSNLESADIRALPQGARSLLLWLNRARAVFSL